MIPLEEEEKSVMLALRDLLVNYKKQGLINPGLLIIQETANEDFDCELDKDETTEVLRSLDENDCVTAPGAFRPRHPNPTVFITPIGWEELERLGKGIPEEWLKGTDRILSVLYEKESENWANSPGNSIYVTERELEEEAGIPTGVFGLVMSYLAENELILPASEGEKYAINEKGANAYEKENYTGEIRGFQ